MESETELQQWMVRYQQGDGDAASALVYRLSPQLYRVFLLQSASRSHADDLLQETWLRVHQVRHTYQPGRPVLPWLYAIARNVRVDHYRKAQRTSQHETELVDVPAPVPSSTQQDFDALLAGLPESQREVIAMLKVAGMSMEEVARATSSSIGSVKQKAHRAYDTLRKGLSALGFAPARKGGPA